MQPAKIEHNRPKLITAVYNWIQAKKKLDLK